MATDFFSVSIKRWNLFPYPWIVRALWFTLTNKMWQKWHWVTSNPRPQEALQCPLLLSWNTIPYEEAQVKPARDTWSSWQSASTTRHERKAISGPPVPDNLPDHSRHLHDPWGEQQKHSPDEFSLSTSFKYLFKSLVLSTKINEQNNGPPRIFISECPEPTNMLPYMAKGSLLVWFS